MNMVSLSSISLPPACQWPARCSLLRRSCLAGGLVICLPSSFICCAELLLLRTYGASAFVCPLRSLFLRFPLLLTDILAALLSLSPHRFGIFGISTRLV